MLRLFTLWLWMCSLLISTVGISIIHIYCYCKNESAVAFSLPWAPADAETTEDCAALGHETASCCRAETAPLYAAAEVSCCGPASMPERCGAAEEGLHPEAHPCTSKTVKIHQLKLDFYSPLSWDKIPELPLWADEVPQFWKCLYPALCWSQPANKAPPEPPPPLSGKQICIRHEVFRC